MDFEKYGLMKAGERYQDLAQLAMDAPFRAQQKRTELAALLHIVDDLKPAMVIEIGCYKGGTIRAWTHVAAHDALIVGIDLPGGPYGGGFDAGEGRSIRSLALEGQRIELLAMNSHQNDTVAEVKKFAGAKADFLFIDADHTYEGARKDYELYSPLVRKGGIIALHDVVRHSKYPDVRVHQLWHEIKQTGADTLELIDYDYPTDHGLWGGIGVILA